MNIVCLTGGMGTGKTSILNLFKKKNINCFNSDFIAKNLMDNDLKEEIKTLFGSDIYEKGKLNRKKISKIVFNDIKKLNKLNSIVHPAVRKNFKDFIKNNEKDKFIVYETALLFETGFNRECDIMECFDKYTENERLDGDNKWLNEKTNKKQDVDKGIVFWSFPDVLVIDFKRFSNQNKKNQNTVHFPRVNLDLTKYVVGYNKDSYKYDLYGICNHTGSVQGGHYFSYIKVNDTDWYEFNDTNVKKMDNPESKIHSPMAYCLFYKKNNN